MTFNALSGVLGIPVVAAALFAALPDYRIAARSNIAATGLTLLCSLSLFFAKPQPGAYLLVHVYRSDQLRRFHHQHFQRQLYWPRTRDRPADTAVRALLSCDVSGVDVCDEPGADRKQYRTNVGGDRTGDAHHGNDGRYLPHARGARGGVEVFHPWQRR